ncbi:MAG: DUF1501 domain-containing protein [Fuerstiella sp.]|nr:DUF1501 domain-containing protein [Fuerstiella sp.]
MMFPTANLPVAHPSRRDIFNWGINGLGATALLSMLNHDASATEVQRGLPQFPAKAKRAIHICLIGGMSHIDSFDYKPALEKFHGKSLQTDEQPDIFFGKVGLLKKQEWRFAPRGDSGLMISDMFPHIAELADDLTILRSMESESANHTPALFLANSGFEANGFPSMGSWVSYGLGSETDSLPAYVVLNDDRGAPNTGTSTWSSAFLPSSSQGVVFEAGDQPVRDLFPAQPVPIAADQATREFVNAVNRRQLSKTNADVTLSARLRSYELAAKMQLSVPEVADVSGETRETTEAYGVNNKQTADMGRRCLLGRRLLERGVRFVQLFSGGPIAGSPRASWDAHESVLDNHTIEAGRIDQPVAALLRDLKQRGMLQDTLVLFTTEFGRTPFAQSAADKVGPGRDHNRYGFSGWMAGAGLKSGFAFGETDEIGWKNVKRPIPWHDFHATVLHLMGIDHKQLTYYHNGIQRRLTNVHGDIVKEILA